MPTRVRVAVSAFDNPGLYYVDLEREDIKGGHGFAKHVARSNTQLIAYHCFGTQKSQEKLTLPKDLLILPAKLTTWSRKY